MFSLSFRRILSRDDIPVMGAIALNSYPQHRSGFTVIQCLEFVALGMSSTVGFRRVYTQTASIICASGAQSSANDLGKFDVELAGRCGTPLSHSLATRVYE